MSGERVDVLAVMGRAAALIAHKLGYDQSTELREARATVAELIEADKEYDTAMRTEADTDGMLRREDARARRSAALSRIQPDGQG